jgi:hypothetical protein
VFARDAALKVAEEGVRWLADTGDSLAVAIPLGAVHRAQRDLLKDMDLVADVVYGRAGKSAAAHAG